MAQQSGERIDEKHDAFDAIEAVLPAGTLSGAPKIRACQLIGELEYNKRGIYGGAIGYIDFTGNMDTCIAIRIAYKKNGKVFVRSGAGIVAIPYRKKEFEECINKAKASPESIGTCTGGGRMILLIDNYDSFSYNLFQLIGEIEPDIRVIRNDEMTAEEIKSLEPDHIILHRVREDRRMQGLSWKSQNAWHEDSGAWSLPWPSGDLRGIWRNGDLCKRTHARKAVECEI